MTKVLDERLSGILIPAPKQYKKPHVDRGACVYRDNLCGLLPSNHKNLAVIPGGSSGHGHSKSAGVHIGRSYITCMAKRQWQSGPEFTTRGRLPDRKLPLDEFRNRPIIGRNTHSQMNPSLFALSLIVILLAVLIIKDSFVVGMARVKVK